MTGGDTEEESGSRAGAGSKTDSGAETDKESGLLGWMSRDRSSVIPSATPSVIPSVTPSALPSVVTSVLLSVISSATVVRSCVVVSDMFVAEFSGIGLSEEDDACDHGDSKGEAEDGSCVGDEAERLGLSCKAWRQVFVAVEHGRDEVVLFVESVEKDDGDVKAHEDDGDFDELLVDGGEKVAERLRDKGCKRAFKKKIVVGKHADDGDDEKEGEKG